MLILFLALFSTYLGELNKEICRLESKIAAYVVTVHTQEGDVTMSGTIVKPNYIVTVCFLEEGEPLQIEDRFGNLSRATAVGRDPITGLTLIKAEKVFAFPKGTKKLRNGEICFVYGNSFGKVGIVGMGFVQSPEGISFNLSIPLSPGNNGAGVFDSYGNLLGVVGGKVNRPGFLYDSGGLYGTSNFAEIIKVEYIFNTIKQIEKMGTVKRGWLGLIVRNTPGDMGVIVEQVIDGSPAGLSGVKERDLIIALNGNNIPDLERFKEMVLSQYPGEVVRLTIIRRKKRLELSVRLVEREGGVDWERMAPDFKIEKLTPKAFQRGKERVKEEIMEQLLRLSEQIELLKKQLKKVEN
ncbi:serine protease [candidate division WOR-3 bacterium]|nr:serine protease [candidate division WOR-3 bacterium]